MLKSLRTALLAAGFAVAVGPALAGGMPAYCTKNFAPGGDVPAIFDNPNLSVAPGDPNQIPISTRYSGADDYPDTRSPGPPARRHIRSAATRSVAHASGHRSRSAVQASARARSRARSADTHSARHS